MHPKKKVTNIYKGSNGVSPSYTWLGETVWRSTAPQFVSSEQIRSESVAKAFVLESEGLYGMPSEHAAFVTYLFVHPGRSSERGR